MGFNQQNVRRPRPSPRPGRRLGPPQVWNLSCRTTLQNPPKPPKPSKPSNPPKPSKPSQTVEPSKHRPKPSKPSKTLQTLQTPFPTGTPGPRPRQFPSIGFQSCRLPANTPNAPLPSKRSPRHPRAKATSQSGTPGPRPQQFPSIGFQMPARKHSKRSKTLQTFQKAPQGQGHFSIRHPRAEATAIAFYWLSNAVCQPANTPNAPKPSKRSKRHPRAKATSQAGTPGPRPQQRLNPPKPSKTLQTLQTPFPTGTLGPRPRQLLSIGFQSCCLPARKHSKRSKTLQTFQKAPQGQGHFSIRHPRAKATAKAFYWLPKLPFSSPQTLQTLQNLPNVPKGTPGPRPLLNQAPQGQGHFSIRHPKAKATAKAFYWLPKLPFASPQTLQTLQNLPNVPKGTPGPKPLLNQAPQGQGQSNFLLLAFKAAVCQPANTPNAPKPSKRSKRHPRAKATSQSGTPGPRPQQLLSIGFQSCRLPARKHSKRSKTLQTFQKAPQGQGHLSSRHPRAKATAKA